VDELKVPKYIDRNRNILRRIELAIETGKLVVKKSQDKYSNIVEEKSKSTGTTKILSKNDVSLMGLVLELMDTYTEDIILYTNDYSMENLCTMLQIRFKPLYKKGIEEKMYFEVYCPYCKTLHKPEDLDKKCERCGLHLKKRLSKKEKL
jgi:rRNA maturation endonuclease Nob1